MNIDISSAVNLNRKSSGGTMFAAIDDKEMYDSDGT